MVASSHLRRDSALDLPGDSRGLGHLGHPIGGLRRRAKGCGSAGVGDRATVGQESAGGV